MDKIIRKIKRKDILKHIDFTIELLSQIIEEEQAFDTPCMYDEVTELAGLVNHMWELKLISFKERCEYLNILFPLGDKAKAYDKLWITL